ncbi:hypothetical protein HRQ91_02300 [Treponema parvum]|uniref:Lipoprotein n=1 Tax=Treponema parvum TaxID=138851 RepID=A0A975F2J9_9SPIR|nr:hypothetical protein [Treponema parvum]QTQ13376.1 hypothetical protein HRQ91_02300 [Treponema parvum]
MKKRKVVVLFAIIISLVGFISCSDPSSSEDNTIYKVEVGAVSNSTYNTAINKISNWSEVNYMNIASLRLYLFNNTISDYGSQTGITLSEIREFLLSHGFSNYKTNIQIENLKTVGNNIIFFYHAYDSNKTIWMYITK